MWSLPDTVALFGNGPLAARTALKKCFSSKECRGPLIIFDAIGRGAAVFDDELFGPIKRYPIIWYDLADRRRPVSLFRLTGGEYLPFILKALFKRIRAAEGRKITDKTLDWAAKAGGRMAQEGRIGLGALLKSLSSSEMRRWFIETQPDAIELAGFLDMLKWALRYPSVCALSESSNRHSFSKDLERAKVIWIELKLENFEPNEYKITAAMIQAVLAQTVLLKTAENKEKNKAERPTLLQVFPSTKENQGFPFWISKSRKYFRHFAVFFLNSNRSLGRLSQGWAENADNLWVIRPEKPLIPSVHSSWAHEDEISRINGLHFGQIWARDKNSGKSIVAGITSKNTKNANPVHLLRTKGSNGRIIEHCRQLSTLADKLVPSSSGKQNLYKQLCDREFLRAGWFRVKKNANKNSHGVDKVTVKQFGESLEKELSSLVHDLRNGKYRCRPLNRVFIPKTDGGRRPLGVCCVRDRVVQSACLQVLEPLFEPFFSHFSFAFRPRRNAHQALAVLRSIVESGRTWAVTADIKKCFDSLDHSVLLRLLTKRVADENLLGLIRHWLTVDILDFSELMPNDIGVPQGEVLSPLLANIYLDPLDKHFEQLGLNFVRYADDLLILTSGKNRAREALKCLGSFLRDPLLLKLKPAKTQFMPITEGVDFLGFTIFPHIVTVQQRRIDGAIDKIHKMMRVLGNPHVTFLQRSQALNHLNDLVRGFRNYFALKDEESIKSQMEILDGRLEQMAHRLLFAKIRDDPAWICRERFSYAYTSMQKSIVSDNSIGGLGYPEERTASSDINWMVKGEKPVHTDGIRQPRNCSRKKEESPYFSSSSMSDLQKNGFVSQDGRVFVLVHGAYIGLDGENLVIKRRKEELRRFHLNEIKLLFLQGLGMNISAQLQIELAEKDIPVVFAPPMGLPIAFLTPIHSRRAYLRGKQVLRRNDPDIITTGLKMIAAKTGNQASVLRYFAKYRRRKNEKLGEDLVDSAKFIREISVLISNIDPLSENVRAVAMGHEGRCAAVYWKQLIKIIPKRFQVDGRIQQTATDPVNQSINYLYGILYGEVWRAIVSVGLDPYFGFVHGSQRDQGSLIFDLIEEFRAPFADRVVLALLGRGFHPDTNKDGRLRTKSRRQLALAFNKRWHKLISWRSRQETPVDILSQQARSLVHVINGTGGYEPFRMKW